MYTYLNQIVACVRRPGRYFTREIMVSRNSAVVTRVEVIPEGYEEIMRARQNPNECVLEAHIPLDASRHAECPFCGNREVYSCVPARGGCGALSCHGRDEREHYCPGCDRVTTIVRLNYLRASGSGFVEQQRLLPPPQEIKTLTIREPGLARTLDLTLFRDPFGAKGSSFDEDLRSGNELASRRLLPPPDEEPEDDSPWGLFRKRRK